MSAGKRISILSKDAVIKNGGYMPLFKIETNKEPQYQNTSVLKSASELISGRLGKPEQYVMVSIETQKEMMFGGNADPTAFVTLKSIGLPVDKCS